jgi:isocitrate/isopropylmalate dehydrogenase
MSAPSSAPVRIVVMEGDGIGPEITAATMRVLAAADRAFGLALSFAPISIGLAALRSEGRTLSERAVEAAKSADGVILGPGSHNEYQQLTRAAAAIDDALEQAIADPKSRTADLGGPLGTKAFGERVAARLSGNS